MRIVDLFSGAGGLTFGFYYSINDGKFVKNKKNEFVFANEFDKFAAVAFRKNFSDINMIEEDIKKLNEDRIIELVGEVPIDIIIGGPPCQSFSTVGKRVYDDKAEMYKEYRRLLAIIRPKMFLFENVKGILSMRETFYYRDENGDIIFDEIKVIDKNGVEKIKKKPSISGYGDKIMDKIQKTFSHINEDLGYTVKFKTLNAVEYGVPQNRERVFIVGVKNDLDVNWEFPEASHGKGKKSIVTLEDAISNFPKAEKLNEKRTMKTRKPVNYYQKLMNSDECLCDHNVPTHGEKLELIIKSVPCREGKNYINNLVDKGELPELCRLTSGYNNTYGRLVPNVPCTTITNNMTTPSALRCIHYKEDRTISPREGARIQSFPDWFNFEGGLTQVTTQIGNAVPPLLAMALAKKIEAVLGGSENE